MGMIYENINLRHSGFSNKIFVAPDRSRSSKRWNSWC